MLIGWRRPFTPLLQHHRPSSTERVIIPSFKTRSTPPLAPLLVLFASYQLHFPTIPPRPISSLKHLIRGAFSFPFHFGHRLLVCSRLVLVGAGISSARVRSRIRESRDSTSTLSAQLYSTHTQILKTKTPSAQYAHLISSSSSHHFHLTPHH